MSASTEKKNRQAAREAGTDKKTLAAQEEARKTAKSKRRWTLGTIGVILLIAIILFLNSSFFYTGTKALTIGGESYSPAQVSYYYANQYYSWANQYGSYASLFGLNTSTGISGLDSQSCPMIENGTWKDYFLQAAQQEMLQNKALLDYAAENGIELSGEEIAKIDESFDGMDEYVKSQGYANVDKFFAANYGRGVNKAVVRQATLDASLANKVLYEISQSFQYSDAQLEEYYKSLNGESDVFDYAYYYVAAEKVDTTNENGETVQAVTDETLTAAKAAAKALVEGYKADETVEDGDVDALAASFDAAVAAQSEDASATRSRNAAGSSLNANCKEWLMGSRKTGDVTMLESSGGDGYYVVLFLGRSDNHYNLAQVRHILVKAEADAEGSYTEEAKAAAYAKAEEIYNEWKSGEKTEDSFAALAEKYSEDSGSNTKGGLYDAVAKGQMVEEFDRFCFEGHKSGDTAIVYGSNGGYAGYHIMYYVGEGELYSNYIAKNGLLSGDMENWVTELCSGYEAAAGYGERFVG